MSRPGGLAQCSLSSFLRGRKGRGTAPFPCNPTPKTTTTTTKPKTTPTSTPKTTPTSTTKPKPFTRKDCHTLRNPRKAFGQHASSLCALHNILHLCQPSDVTRSACTLDSFLEPLHLPLSGCQILLFA